MQRKLNQNVLRNLEQQRFNRRLSQKAKKLERNRKRSAQKQHPLKKIAKKSSKSRDPWANIEAPVEIDLASNRDETCEFINNIKEYVRYGNRVRINFEKCQNIRLSGLIVLLAQIHKLRLQYGQDQITGTYPDSPRIERLLSDSGFYKLLHVRSRKKTRSASKLTRFIPFRSEQKPTSSEIPALRDELLGEDLKMPTIIKKKVFRALSEAMTNVNHHAYKTKSNVFGKHLGRWWMVATLSNRTRLFTLVFYDAGVGIPKTLPRRYPIELIRGALSLLPMIKPDDGQMIHAAMELGRTRTAESNRGKGLIDLAKLIDTAAAGSMSIYSRNGSYAYTPTLETHKNHQGFIEGTLIEWQLPIDKAIENLPQEIIDEIETYD